MKRFSIILLAFSPVLMSACAANSNIEWIIPESERTNYAAVPTGSIVMFRQGQGDSPSPQNYVALATITVRTSGFGDLTGTLRKEAGKLGANAIIVVQDIRVGVGEEPPPPKREPTCEDIEVENNLSGFGGPTDGAGVLAAVGLACLAVDATKAVADLVEADFSDGGWLQGDGGDPRLHSTGRLGVR